MAVKIQEALKDRLKFPVFLKPVAGLKWVAGADVSCGKRSKTLYGCAVILGLPDLHLVHASSFRFATVRFLTKQAFHANLSFFLLKLVY